MTFFQWIKDNEETLVKASSHVLETYFPFLNYNCVIEGLDFKPFQDSVLQCEEFKNISIEYVDIPVFSYYGKFYRIEPLQFRSKDEKIYESIQCQKYFDDVMSKYYEMAWYGFSVSANWTALQIRVCNLSNPYADMNRRRIKTIDKILSENLLIVQ